MILIVYDINKCYQYLELLLRFTRNPCSSHRIELHYKVLCSKVIIFNEQLECWFTISYNPYSLVYEIKKFHFQGKLLLISWKYV